MKIKIEKMTQKQRHDFLCLHLKHSIENRDSSKILAVLQKTKGYTRSGLLLWIERFTPFTPVLKSAKFDRNKMKYEPFEVALVTPYYTLVKKPEPKPNSTAMLRNKLSEFITNPGDVNYKALVDEMMLYKNLSNSPVKKALARKPNNIVQGGSSSSKR